MASNSSAGADLGPPDGYSYFAFSAWAEAAQPGTLARRMDILALLAAILDIGGTLPGRITVKDRTR